MPIKSVPIELDKRRNLRFDYNALCELEGHLGVSIPNLGNILASGSVGLKEIRAILWAGLLHEDESLTVKKVGEILDDVKWTKNIDKITQAVLSAFEAAFPTAKESEKNEPGPKTDK